MEGHKVRVVADRPDFTGARVFLDDKELIGISAVDVRVAVPGIAPTDVGVNKVRLELEPAELDIEVRVRKVDWFEERPVADEEGGES